MVKDIPRPADAYQPIFHILYAYSLLFVRLRFISGALFYFILAYLIHDTPYIKTHIYSKVKKTI